jgi:hypothetical protein
VAIERRIGGRAYRKVAEAKTDERGYFRTRLPLGTTAQFRYSWNAGTSTKTKRYSDAITVRPR